MELLHGRWTNRSKEVLLKTKPSFFKNRKYINVIFILLQIYKRAFWFKKYIQYYSIDYNLHKLSFKLYIWC